MDNLLIVIILVLGFGYIFLHLNAQNNKLKQSIKNIEIVDNNNQIRSTLPDRMVPNVRQPMFQETVISLQHPSIKDSIVERDYKVVTDPLAPAVKRPASHIFPPTEFTRYIDIPTRGYPDSFQYLGNMFRINGNSEISGEKVVKLFGRQKYAGSNQYDYYGITNDSSTLNYKIPIMTKHDQEIFDGDTINVPSLGGTFQVNLHPDQTFRYNPYIL
jgi:hypothetical protein